ncbi:glycosyltransferase family 2 protein [Diaminobutyricimonas sp. LJ205]|uniref:glycosyltransferase family 2 protein n=1 Tax=Diaminobutyricimonas sp. LJ205 TaxID=2683590 RepID=UPI0018DFBEF3|nr:glycosyltransferase family 2 protein [Diaminobutyricimonas sp. LJ205]
MITVTYRSSDVLPAFLSSTTNASSLPPVVHVADNSEGSDPRIHEVTAGFDGVILHELPSNAGYGGAVNDVAHTLPDPVQWILVANPDLTWEPGSLDKLMEATSRHPEGAIFGPRILTEAGDTYPSARRLPSLRTGIGHALFSRVWPSNPWSARYRDDQNTMDEERTSGWLSGACMLIRRDVFDSVHGFDRRFFMYFEDVDLCRRVGSEGWTCVYVPDARVTHIGAHSTGQASSAMIRAHHDSAYIYLRDKYAAWYLWPVRIVLKLGLRVRARLSGSSPSDQR